MTKIAREAVKVLAIQRVPCFEPNKNHNTRIHPFTHLFEKLRRDKRSITLPNEKKTSVRRQTNVQNSNTSSKCKRNKLVPYL